MARWLKQSTSVDVPIGPFLDATDGVTAETALTITQPDIRLKKNGGAWAQKNAAQTLSHEENGNYEVTLDATDTNTLGLLRLAVAESGALPIWEDFLVLPANVYDALVSASDALQVHTNEITDGLLVAATFGANSINAAKLDPDVTTELQNGLATASALSTVSGKIDTIDDFLDTEVAAIKAKTDNLPSDPADASDIAALIDALPTAAENADAIWDEAMSGHTTAGTYGDKLRAHAAGVLKALMTSGSTTTAVVLNATTGIEGAAPSSTNDFYNGRVIVFISGALAGQATDITDYVGATKTLTVTALTSAPSSGDTAVIV